MKKMWKSLIVLIGGGVATLAAIDQGLAADSGADQFDSYRAMLADDNPGQFWIDDGSSLFHKPRGPNKAPLDACDFGLGPGVVKGAYAQMPRYFKDADRVQTLEGRIVWCAETLQGIKPEQLLEPHYKNASEENSTADELTQIAAYVAAQSNGMAYALPLNSEQERYSYALGKYVFYRRMGKMDLSCASCHDAPGRTIRGVTLPVMTDPKTAGAVMAAFPAYVIKDGNVRTFWWRNERCLLAMRLPWLMTGSEIDAALTLFQAVQAQQSETPIQVPGIKPRA